jgi:hypothetical protein
MLKRSSWAASKQARLLAWAIGAEMMVATLLLGGGIARQHCELQALTRAASAQSGQAAEAAYADAAACYGERLPTLEERSYRAWQEVELSEQTWI